ncbi:MAG TPA: TetR/AcrR family transcriptional regulator [Myxococcota bacterium]
MTTVTRTPSRASARPRRSQAERSATTRRKIIDAVAAVIAEEGFAQASSHRIAKRAGVTWGAVQYHFGAKADILGAVMDDGLERFARRTRDLSLDGRPLAQRVSLLVDRCWEFYSSLHYRAMLEIVLNARSAEASERRASHRRFAEAVCQAWSKAFADVDLSRERRLEAERFACSALSGLAVQAMLEGGPLQVRQELAILKTAIARLLAPA